MWNFVYQGHNALQADHVFTSQRIDGYTIHVENPHHVSRPVPAGHDHLASGPRIAGDVAFELAHIRNENGFSSRDTRPTYAGAPG